MRRRLGGIFRVCCLVLCVGVVALWVKDRHSTDSVGVDRVTLSPRGGETRDIYIACTYGGIEIGQVRRRYPDMNLIDPGFRAALTKRANGRWQACADQSLPLSGMFRHRSLPWWERLGFRWVKLHLRDCSETGAQEGFRDVHALTVPCWLVVTLLALPPGWPVARGAVRRWRTARAKREGFCAKCGYDLRATPRRCPECGTEVASGVSIPGR